MSKRILVCGGRNYGLTKEEQQAIRSELTAICYENGWSLEPDEYGNWLPDVFVISGAAKGVDTAAIDWAVENWCNFKEYPADWDKYPKAAGPIRNKQMLDEGKPDVVIAFKGGTGTANMIMQAEKAGVPVIKIEQ